MPWYWSQLAWLLLQNSWEDMPLVEVSLDYLVACDASISFPTSKRQHRHKIFRQLSDQEWYAVNAAKVAECNNVDRAETCGRGGCFYIEVRDRSPWSSSLKNSSYENKNTNWLQYSHFRNKSYLCASINLCLSISLGQVEGLNRKLSNVERDCSSLEPFQRAGKS